MDPPDCEVSSPLLMRLQKGDEVLLLEAGWFALYVGNPFTHLIQGTWSIQSAGCREAWKPEQRFRLPGFFGSPFILSQYEG